MRATLSELLSSLARELQEDHGDVDATLAAITAGAVRTVPHAQYCGISYVIGKKVEPRAWTDELARAVDSLQTRLGQGPCLDAVREQLVVRVDDVAADQRWPQFAKEAGELGVRSMMCFRLFVEADHLGALTLSSRTTGACDDESQDVGLLFAGHAAIALAGA